MSDELTIDALHDAMSRLRERAPEAQTIRVHSFDDFRRALYSRGVPITDREPDAPFARFAGIPIRVDSTLRPGTFRLEPVDAPEETEDD